MDTYSMTNAGYYHDENAYKLLWLCVNLNLVKMQISIIWEPNEAKSLHRLWQGRDPPGISQGENHLTTFDPYDLKYIGSYLGEDLFHLTRPTHDVCFPFIRIPTTSCE